MPKINFMFIILFQTEKKMNYSKVQGVQSTLTFHHILIFYGMKMNRYKYCHIYYIFSG